MLFPRNGVVCWLVGGLIGRLKQQLGGPGGGFRVSMGWDGSPSLDVGMGFCSNGFEWLCRYSYWTLTRSSWVRSSGGVSIVIWKVDVCESVRLVRVGDSEWRGFEEG